MRRFVVVLAVLVLAGYFTVKHLTHEASFRFSYEVTPQGRILLRAHTIAFDAAGDIYVASASGVRRATDSASYPENDPLSQDFYRNTQATAPSLSPDGRWLAFLKANDDGDAELFVARADGSGELTDLSPSGGTKPSWDAKSLSILIADFADPWAGLTPGTPAYTRADREYDKNLSHGRTQVFRVGLDGRASPLTGGVNELSNPVWSPGGTQIAFVSTPPFKADQDFLSQPNTIWVMRGDGSGRKPLFTVKEMLFEMSWTPDGEHLRASGLWRNWLVDAASGRAVRVGDVGAADLSYSADGRLAARGSVSGIVVSDRAASDGTLSNPRLVIAANARGKAPEGKRPDPFYGGISIR